MLRNIFHSIPPHYDFVKGVFTLNTDAYVMFGSLSKSKQWNPFVSSVISSPSLLKVFFFLHDQFVLFSSPFNNNDYEFLIYTSFSR